MTAITRWLGNLLDRRAMVENPYTLLNSPMSYAGPVVTEENALRSSAVFACVRIISESIASLPLVLYQQDGRSRERAKTHPLYPILHDLANPEMTSLEWRELAIGHVALWGNHWSEIEYSRDNGQIIGLWPLRPDKIEGYERRPDGIWWLYRLPNNEPRWIPSNRLHHIRTMGDGVMGYSPIRTSARQAIGLSLATEEFGARFFSNGARPGMLIRHPGKLSAPAYERLKRDFADAHQGLSNAHRARILEEGMDITTIGIPPDEAQFIETRKFQVTEIARIFRVPPHMLADLDRATFSNIEQQSLEFVMYTLRPWLVRHEQAIYRDLLNPTERNILYAKYIVDGLLRGDTQTRYAAYTTGINTGFLTRNEARELEDLNPIDGLDTPLQPVNMMEVGVASQSPVRTIETVVETRQLTDEQRKPTTGMITEAERGLAWREEFGRGGTAVGVARARDIVDRIDDDRHNHEQYQVRAEVSDPQAWDTRSNVIRAERQAIMNRNIRLWQDAAERMVKREVADIRRAAKRNLSTRDAESFQSWLTRFYEQMREWMPDYYRALMETYAETIMAAIATELDGEPAPLDNRLQAWIEGYLRNFAISYTFQSENQMRALIERDDTEDAIEEKLDKWSDQRAEIIARQQSFEAGNALSVIGYIIAGRQFLRWSARGESCPLCRKLDGRRIPIDGAFLDEGSTLEAEGTNPLTSNKRISHGPLHGGCDCVVIGG